MGSAFEQCASLLFTKFMICIRGIGIEVRTKATISVVLRIAEFVSSN